MPLGYCGYPLDRTHYRSLSEVAAPGVQGRSKLRGLPGGGGELVPPGVVGGYRPWKFYPMKLVISILPITYAPCYDTSLRNTI